MKKRNKRTSTIDTNESDFQLDRLVEEQEIERIERSARNQDQLGVERKIATKGKSNKRKCGSGRNLFEGDDEPNQDKFGENKIKWTKNDNQATKSLISLREEYHPRFENPMTTKAALGRRIARQMDGFGYGTASADICKKKWHNLMSTYKTHLDLSNKTGEGKVTWDLFELMHKIVGQKGSINPDPSQLASFLAGPSSVVDTKKVGKKRKNKEPEWIANYKMEKDLQQQQHQKLEEQILAEYKRIEEEKIAAFKEVEGQKLELLKNILESLRK